MMIVSTFCLKKILQEVVNKTILFLKHPYMSSSLDTRIFSTNGYENVYDGPPHQILPQQRHFLLIVINQLHSNGLGRGPSVGPANLFNPLLYVEFVSLLTFAWLDNDEIIFS